MRASFVVGSPREKGSAALPILRIVDGMLAAAGSGRGSLQVSAQDDGEQSDQLPLG
jgi:hypothetical protein